ncbi:Glycylpeptide N-tetradecanoyltransferase 1 [Aduncisulcus paluster]|uniref:Glycylpeptide N-tetradecanoyltransferase n=1 Tax=Aduncisulcus paluster TaxID=2918883 RepID=A0ABQ5KZY4_9EUKA|nr:Glycylpeptide N-tetradecanoyltransferase 1 [Aduncisulcus paluster]|eukprot:gnl/Carplike_NY0171/1581_a2139_1090.p1 GENE.gnl/Carplike_NY0171/1581_a2139_1090~~gnl/Carplike_NY0171/1581_a2139_1090.p1  ORF type:complete len:446 (+),score=117.06 gnl/Carplike_NY0171/1581_a2139_1090:2-1339(+)
MAEESEHKFWKTMPVPQTKEEISKQKGELVSGLEHKGIVPTEPSRLPAGFEWSDLNLSDLHGKDMTDLYEFLRDNYVSDEGNLRFDYSPETIHWVLFGPGSKSEYHIAVRLADSKKIVGFIGAIPAHIRVNDKSVFLVEINFLCVHISLRSKRLAPVLIKEARRRANVNRIFQAIYTAGIVVPTPIISPRFFHRLLQPKKCIKCGFAAVSSDDSEAAFTLRHELPRIFDNPLFTGTKYKDRFEVTLFIKKDQPEVQALTSKYLSQFKVAPDYSKKEFAHTYLPRDEVVYTYCVYDNEFEEIPKEDAKEEGEKEIEEEIAEMPVTKKCRKLVAMFSFYIVRSTVLKPPEEAKEDPSYNHIAVAYSQCICVDDSASVITKEIVMTKALYLARDKGCDVFNALTMSDHTLRFFKYLNFVPGDGILNYYLFNYSVGDEIQPKDVHVILI